MWHANKMIHDTFVAHVHEVAAIEDELLRFKRCLYKINSAGVSHALALDDSRFRDWAATMVAAALTPNSYRKAVAGNTLTATAASDIGYGEPVVLVGSGASPMVAALRVQGMTAEAAELEMREDMLSDCRTQLGLIADALGVSYEPHQSYFDRLLEAARGKTCSAG